MIKANVETLKIKFFCLITRRNITKKYDEILSFDYPLSVYISIYNIYIYFKCRYVCEYKSDYLFI